MCECEGERGVACSERSESAVKRKRGRAAVGLSTPEEDLVGERDFFSVSSIIRVHCCVEEVYKEG